MSRVKCVKSISSKVHEIIQLVDNFYFSICVSINYRLAHCQKELTDEREMIKALRSNQSAWESKCSQLEEKFEKYQTKKEAEIIDLKDEIRDLMFYMEAQNAVANSQLKDEINDTSITISPPSNTSTTDASGSKRGRRKKK